MTNNMSVDTNLIALHTKLLLNEQKNIDDPVNIIVTDRKCAENEYKGGYAVVYEMQDQTTGEIYAGKIIDKKKLTKPKAWAKFKQEITIHKMLNHPNVIKLYNVFQDFHNVYLLLEKCDQQTMMDLVSKRSILNEIEGVYYMKQIIIALKYCHSQKIIHRDLKLSNLCVHNNSIKLGDFGLATFVEDENQLQKKICGTPNYVAPEVLTCRDTPESSYSYSADIWSLGCVMYAMLVGKPPFETTGIRLTYQRIKNNEYSYPLDCKISQEGRDLISKMLKLAPDKRISLKEMEYHPWFSKYHIENDLILSP